MAKRKKRAVPADLWLDRATAAQVEKMRMALHIAPASGVAPKDDVPWPKAVPLHPVPVLDNALPEGQRSVSWGVDDLGFDTAYVCEKVKPQVDGGVPSYRLLKLLIERGVVIHIEAGVENLREIVLQDIEDHILRDA